MAPTTISPHAVRMRRANQRPHWRRGWVSTRRIRIQQRARKSCWPSSQRWHSPRCPRGLRMPVDVWKNNMSCCENGRPIITDPVSGHTVCSCQYDSARLTLGGYSRMALPSAGVGVYGGPYPSNEQNPYPSIGVDNSAFYSPLVSEIPFRILANWIKAASRSPRWM